MSSQVPVYALTTPSQYPVIAIVGEDGGTGVVTSVDGEVGAVDLSGTYVPLVDGVVDPADLPEFRPERYGAVGDGIRHLSSGSITSGTTTLVVTGANFSQATDVGKLIGISVHATTIASVTNATTVELASAPAATYTNASVVYGTNDYAALAAAIVAARVAGGVVKLRAKHYCYGTATLLPGADSVTFEGEGERASVLCAFGLVDAILWDGSAGAIRYGGMRKCHVRGFGCTGSGVVIHNAVEFAFQKLTVTGFLTTNKYGIETRGTTGNFINSFVNVTSSGNYRGLLNNGQAAGFRNCRFQGNTDMGVEDYGYAPTFDTCDFEGNGGIGIDTQQNESKAFINCYWERNVTAQLKCIQTHGLTILGGRMYGGAGTPTDKGIILGRTAGDTVSNAVIKGLVGIGHTTCDIEVLGAIGGCDITGNYLSSTTDIVVDAAAQLTGDVKIQGKRLGILAPDDLLSGEAVMDREMGTGNMSGLSSGQMLLSYFTAKKTEVVTQVRLWTGATAAGATPTVCRIGVWSVDAAGVYTLVATTPNDTALFATQNTEYTKAFSASFTKTAGVRYAVGVLVVTGAAMPSFLGLLAATNASSAPFALDPRLSALHTGLADLPALPAGLANSTRRCQAVLLP